MFTVKKSTHGEYNKGRNRLWETNFGNSRYTGSTVVWVLHDESTWAEEGLIALYRKSDAEAMAAYFNEIGWDGVTGDPMMKFEKHLSEIEDWDRLDKIKEV